MKKVLTKKNIVIIIATAFVLLNILAFMHAYKMTTYSKKGVKTHKPEELTFGQKFVYLFTGVNVPKPGVVFNEPDFNYRVINFPGYKNVTLESWMIENKKNDELVIMFHGYSEGKSQLFAEAENFADKGYNVMLVDCYGSGGSDGNSTSVGYYEAEDVKAAFSKAVKLGYNKIVLYAVSMGSASAMRAISLYNLEPCCLIIESPFAGLLNTVRKRFHLMNAPSFLFAEMLVFWGGVIQGYNGFSHNPSEYAKMIKVPVLVLHGEKDRRVTLNQAKKLYDNLAGKKKLVVLSDAAHVSFMKTNREEWEKEVFNFIRSNLK